MPCLSFEAAQRHTGAAFDQALVKLAERAAV